MLDRIYFEDEAEDNVFEDCNVVQDFGNDERCYMKVDIQNSELTKSHISSKLFREILQKIVYDRWSGKINFFYLNGNVDCCLYVTENSDEVDCVENIAMDIGIAFRIYTDLVQLDKKASCEAFLCFVENEYWFVFSPPAINNTKVFHARLSGLIFNTH